MAEGALRATDAARPSVRLRWWAVATAVVTFLLLSVGGVVTSRDAGLVFADWPLSNGSAMPDGWTANPDQRAEHGHRLLGALGGILAVVLTVWTFRRDRRTGVRLLAVAVLVGFGVQGLLGGLRVTERSGTLAFVHGAMGQALFCAVVALAYFLCRDGTSAHARSAGARGVARAGTAALLTIYAQVILGAHFRHHGGHIQFHLLGALMVIGTVLWAVTVTMARSGDKALRRPALGLLALTGVQILLGLVALAVVSGHTNTYSLVEVALPTAHQVCGALLLVSTLLLTLRAAGRAQRRREVSA